MKRKHILLLFICFVLIQVLVLSACGQTGTTTSTSQPAQTVTVTATPSASTVSKAQDPVHKVINPAGIYIPVECKPCAPRLDTLAGKKILYYEADATNMQMPELLNRLKAEFPTATFDIVYTESWGETTPTEAYLKYQATIRGVGW